jgi:hypothetical protein
LACNDTYQRRQRLEVLAVSNSTSPAFVSYSRADSEFSLRLAKDLKAAGASVWLDQLDIMPGEPWDEKIEEALIDARQMILILSPSSAKSRNVRDEISFALGQGKVVIPVLYADCVVPLRLQRQQRIDFRADYSHGLEALLDHLRVEKPDQGVLKEASEAEVKRKLAWRARELAAQRLQRENGNSQFSTTLEPEQEKVPEGEPARRSVYVERFADQELRTALDRGDSIICIRCHHQAGKTLTLAHGLEHARKRGKRVVVVDLQKFGESDFESFDRFCKALGGLIADQLDLDVSLESTWNESRSPSLNLERYLNRHVLPRMNGGVVLAIDELDRLFPREFSSEVFGLFRSWHNERAISPDSPMNRLTVVLLYTNARHLFIEDPNQSPFNFCVNIELQDFGQREIAEFARLREIPLGIGELQRFQDLLGGNPYLVGRGLDALEVSRDFEEFAMIADSEEGPFADHLRQVLLIVEADFEVAEAVRKLLQSGQIPDRDKFYSLRLAGIVTGSTPHDAQFRAGIYKTYLSRHLLGKAPHNGV